MIPLTGLCFQNHYRTLRDPLAPRPCLQHAKGSTRALGQCTQRDGKGEYRNGGRSRSIRLGRPATRWCSGGECVQAGEPNDGQHAEPFGRCNDDLCRDEYNYEVGVLYLFISSCSCYWTDESFVYSRRIKRDDRAAQRSGKQARHEIFRKDAAAKRQRQD